ncbi:hypothetical protein [Rhodoplanes roseus]|uniref:hypothetical protein n=1 Tax=Rhodoplanes roseus TaxID=29409 RepID=UPI0011B66719|nr:hypothetical protein [Rhodoplanes roseus]
MTNAPFELAPFELAVSRTTLAAAPAATTAGDALVSVPLRHIPSPPFRRREIPCSPHHACC